MKDGDAAIAKCGSYAGSVRYDRFKVKVTKRRIVAVNDSGGSVAEFRRDTGEEVQQRGHFGSRWHLLPADDADALAWFDHERARRHATRIDFSRMSTADLRAFVALNEAQRVDDVAAKLRAVAAVLANLRQQLHAAEDMNARLVTSPIADALLEAGENLERCARGVAP